MNLNDLSSFVRVVDLGTITAAANEQQVPKSTISRRIARLEDALGVELLRRSARAFTLTPDGQRLYERSTGALRELSDVAHALADAPEQPSGRLVLTAAHDLGRTPLMGALLAEYRRRYPAVVVEVRLELRMVDLIQEGVDIALRAHRGDLPGDSGLMARSLSAPQARLYASQDYIARRGAPQTPDALAAHDLIAHQAMMRQPVTLTSPLGELRLDALSPVVIVNDFGMAQTLVEAGAGIALLPGIDDLAALATGPLRPILPDWHVAGARLSIIWPASRHLAPRVRAFVDLAASMLVFT
jgi:DNA-binding transcriptional LysR family regulator